MLLDFRYVLSPEFILISIIDAAVIVLYCILVMVIDDLFSDNDAYSNLAWYVGVWRNTDRLILSLFYEDMRWIYYRLIAWRSLTCCETLIAESTMMMMMFHIYRSITFRILLRVILTIYWYIYSVQNLDRKGGRS
jgi:hypothetical protein